MMVIMTGREACDSGAKKATWRLVAWITLQLCTRGEVALSFRDVSAVAGSSGETF